MARVVLTEPGHRGRSYALTGPEPITPRRQLETIAAALGHSLSVVEVDRARARERLIQGMGPEDADALLDVSGGDPNDELLTVRDTVTQVTGARTRTFPDWVSQHIDAFRAGPGE